MKPLRYAALVAIAFVPGWIRQRTFERASRAWRGQLIHEITRRQQALDKELGAWATKLVRDLDKALKAGR